MPYFMISARTAPDSQKTGQTLRYLRSDDGVAYTGVRAASWVAEIIARLEADDPNLTKEVLFFVHGFNVSEASAAQSHKIYAAHLQAAGWKGLLISFDWPSAGLTFAYVPDRLEARLTASRLVSGGIALLQKAQDRKCTIAVDVLCHSMGAFVVELAFNSAYQDVPPNWSVDQLLLVAADVGVGDFATGQRTADSFQTHAGRVTVYTNRYDKALAVSTAKRVGLAPRLGRIGLPDDAPDLMCSVDCSPLFDAVDPGLGLHLDPNKTHSFYFDQAIFWQDVVLTLAGGTDRQVIETRVKAPDTPLPNRFDLKTKPLDGATYKLALARADLNADRTARLA